MKWLFGRSETEAQAGIDEDPLPFPSDRVQSYSPAETRPFLSSLEVAQVNEAETTVESIENDDSPTDTYETIDRLHKKNNAIHRRLHDRDINAKESLSQQHEENRILEAELEEQERVVVRLKAMLVVNKQVTAEKEEKAARAAHKLERFAQQVANDEETETDATSSDEEAEDLEMRCVENDAPGCAQDENAAESPIPTSSHTARGAQKSAVRLSELRKRKVFDSDEEHDCDDEEEREEVHPYKESGGESFRAPKRAKYSHRRT